MKPMLAAKSAEHAPPLGDGWIYERKYDGIRALAGLRAGRPWITSREGADLTARFPEVCAAVAGLPWTDAIIDGELVGAGLSALQWRMGLAHPGEHAQRRAPAVLHAFDLLSGPEGADFTSAPLDARKALLGALLKHGAGIVYVEDTVDGTALWTKAISEGWEGIMAKRLDGLYRPGTRSPGWIKVKVVFAKAS